MHPSCWLWRAWTDLPKRQSIIFWILIAATQRCLQLSHLSRLCRKYSPGSSHHWLTGGSVRWLPKRDEVLLLRFHRPGAWWRGNSSVLRLVEVAESDHYNGSFSRRNWRPKFCFRLAISSSDSSRSSWRRTRLVRSKLHLKIDSFGIRSIKTSLLG